MGPFCYLCFVFVFAIPSCLFLAALQSPAGKGLNFGSLINVYLFNSFATPFGSTLMSSIKENGLAPSESASRVKAALNCLLQMLAFSFASVLRILSSLSEAIPSASFFK